MVISILLRGGWAGLVAAMDMAMWREDWRLETEGILSYCAVTREVELARRH